MVVTSVTAFTLGDPEEGTKPSVGIAERRKVGGFDLER